MENLRDLTDQELALKVRECIYELNCLKKVCSKRDIYLVFGHFDGRFIKFETDDIEVKMGKTITL